MMPRGIHGPVGLHPMFSSSRNAVEFRNFTRDMDTARQGLVAGPAAFKQCLTVHDVSTLVLFGCKTA